MTEEKFYDLLDEAGEIGPLTNNYFPTVEDMKAHKVSENIDTYMPILMYLSGDPYRDTDLKNDPGYKQSVAYAKKVLYSYDNFDKPDSSSKKGKK